MVTSFFCCYGGNDGQPIRAWACSILIWLLFKTLVRNLAQSTHPWMRLWSQQLYSKRTHNNCIQSVHIHKSLKTISPHPIVFNHAEISFKTLVSWSHFIHLSTIASSRWTSYMNNNSFMLPNVCVKQGSLFCFVTMRFTKPGCFRSCSWYLWKALEEEVCISLVSWHLDLHCKSSWMLNDFFTKN